MLNTTRAALWNVSDRRSRLVDTYTNGDIEESLYREKLDSLHNEATKIKQQITELEAKDADPLKTIELIYFAFKQGYTMADRYRAASPEEKRVILAGALLNSTLLNLNIVDL